MNTRTRMYRCGRCKVTAPHTVVDSAVDRTDPDRAGWWYTQTQTCGKCGASVTGKVYPHLLDFVFSIPARRKA